MTQAWDRIESWIKVNHPSMISTLNIGATIEDLRQLENKLGQILPEDFKKFLEVHNGQTWTHLNLFDGDRLLDTENIFCDWDTWKKVLPEIDADCTATYGQPASSSPDKGIKDDWWNMSWIPITSNGSGDSYCIDLDPTPEGTRGQIIRMLHDHPSREVIAQSFRDWIYAFVNDLERNVYEPSNDIGWGGIVRTQ